MRFLLVILVLFSKELFAQNFIFKNGSNGYACYRIPAIVKTKNGKLLAFAEGRKKNALDSGDIDLVMKTSTDNGATWSLQKKVWDSSTNTCGNPSPVVDYGSGGVIVIATLNNFRIFVLKSVDEGENWLQPEDITNSIKPGNWTWYASGPGHAIQYQILGGKHRIIVPCNHKIKGNSDHIAHAIYSDDVGASWQLGGSVPNSKTDECTAVQLSNGKVLLNIRSDDRTLPNRKVATSTDNGLTWSAAVYDSSLIDPSCQGALLRYSFDTSLLLFCNPKNKFYRKNLTISISSDNGRSWPNEVVIEPAESAYSDMVELSDGSIIVLYETGQSFPNSGIVVKKVSPASILSPLVIMNAVKGTENIEITWTMLNNRSIDYIEIQRSLDGLQFDNIGVVTYKESNLNGSQYVFSDVSAATQYASKRMLYYRLRMVNKNGSERYSSIREVAINDYTIFSVTASPVPFDNLLKVSINSSVESNANIYLFDFLGRKVLTKKMSLVPGNNAINLNAVSGLGRGLYLLFTEVNGQFIRLKILK